MYHSLVHNIDGLAQDCSKSSANALELLQSCAKLPIHTTWWEIAVRNPVMWWLTVAGIPLVQWSYLFVSESQTSEILKAEIKSYLNGTQQNSSLPWVLSCWILRHHWNREKKKIEQWLTDMECPTEHTEFSCENVVIFWVPWQIHDIQCSAVIMSSIVSKLLTKTCHSSPIGVNYGMFLGD